jgi:putative oxidoreductase
MELTGALLIVVPRTKFFGAALLSLVMIGAVLTHLFILHNAPTAAAVLLVFAGVVAWARRGEATP